MAERMSQAATNAGIEDTKQHLAETLARAKAQIAEHWIGYLVLGIVLVLAGMAAIVFPYLSTIAAKIALGWIFVFSGVAIIVHAFSAGDWRGFFFDVAVRLVAFDCRRLSGSAAADRHPHAHHPDRGAVDRGRPPGSRHGSAPETAGRLGLDTAQRTGGDRCRLVDRAAAAEFGDLDDRSHRRHQNDLCRLGLYYLGPRGASARGASEPACRLTGTCTRTEAESSRAPP